MASEYTSTCSRPGPAAVWGAHGVAAEACAARAAVQREAWREWAAGPRDGRATLPCPTHLLVRVRANRERSHSARRLAPACTPARVKGVSTKLDELRRLPLRGARRVPLAFRGADLHEPPWRRPGMAGTTRAGAGRRRAGALHGGSRGGAAAKRTGLATTGHAGPRPARRSAARAAVSA
jgi:hypothetical protein